MNLNMDFIETKQKNQTNELEELTIKGSYSKTSIYNERTYRAKKGLGKKLSVELKEYLCHCIFGYLTLDHHFYEIACGHDYS